MGGLQVTSTDAWSAELCTTDTAVGGPGNSTDNENKVITIQGQGQTKTRSSLYIGMVKKNLGHHYTQAYKSSLKTA